MARHIAPKPLIIQDENRNILPKKALADGNKLKSFGAPTKSGGTVAKDRKALNDITNKSSKSKSNETNQAKVSSRKESPKEEFNYAEEGFLHDHRKCIASQQVMKRAHFLDTVLPGHNEFWNMKPIKGDVTESSQYYPEPVEMPMFEFSEWANSTFTWKSPPSSPINCDFPLSSPFAWQHEPFEFFLKEGDHL